MTGTLVKLGQRITEALLGGNRWACSWYLLLGDRRGGYARTGLGSPWIAAPVAALLTVASGMIGEERR